MVETSVNLIVACLFKDEAILKKAIVDCCLLWGEIDHHSSAFAFDMTDYYEPEMGKGLYRVFISFKQLVNPERMSIIKHECERIEKKLSDCEKRSVNLDPGYIDMHKYVLMSYKYGGQKLYIGCSVWADMTLMYKNSRWQSFDWTFPDFKDDRYYGELSKIRELYKNKCKNIKKFC